MAEARGFEPPRRVSAHTISSRAPSTTRPRFLFYHTIFEMKKPPPKGWCPEIDRSGDVIGVEF